MFCPNCGKPVEEGKKFCGDCGAAMPDGQVNSLQKEPVKTLSFHPDPFAIVFGIFIIIFINIVPFVQINIFGLVTGQVTLARYSQICMQGYPGCVPTVFYTYYGLWVVGIILVIWGVFQRK